MRGFMNYCQAGGCGLFSSGGFIIFDRSQAKTNFGAMELMAVAVLGVAGGTLGSLFNQLNLSICRYRQKAR